MRSDDLVDDLSNGVRVFILANAVIHTFKHGAPVVEPLLLFGHGRHSTITMRAVGEGSRRL